jgi:iron complex outermembrane receptor protein
LRLGAALLAALLATVRGYPQAPAPADDPPVILPPWAVEERADRQLQSARSDSFASTLGPTSVVSAAAWSGRPVGTLAEALRRAPGVMMQESFGGFEPPRLSIRGSGLDSAPTSRSVALLVDGLPLARADGSFHSGLFDPLLFPQVEIYRGTMHMALTPAVLGGVLNAVSAPGVVANGTAVRIEGGEFRATRAQLSSTFGSAETTARVAGALARTDGWRDHSAQARAAVDLSLRRMLSAFTRLELSAYLARMDYDVPGPLTLADALTRPQSVSAAVTRDLPRREANVFRVAGQLKSARPGGTLSAGVAWQRLHDDFFQLQANGETDSVSDDFSGHATWSRRLALTGVEHHVLARATFSTGVNTVMRFLNDRSRRGARFAAFAGRANTAALCLEDIVWLHPTVAAGAGFTALHARRELADRFNPAGGAASLARTLRLDDLSPRAGLVWHPRGQLSLHAAASRGIEPPGFDDLLAVQGVFPNFSLRSRELRAQRATTFEIGSRGGTGPLTWDVTAYHSFWHGEILRLADASGQPRGAVNAGRTLHTGLETSLRWRFLEGPHRLALGVTSTVGRFRFERDAVYGSNRIGGAPPHLGTAELVYEEPHGVYAALESTWVAGRTAVDHAGRLGYGGHTLLHARLGWRRNDRVAMWIAVRNLLDRSHLASTAGVLDLARAPATTMIFLPGSARALTLGFEWKR